MTRYFLYLLLFVCCGGFSAYSQTGSMFFQEELQKAPDQPMATAVHYSKERMEKLLTEKSIAVKYATSKLIYIQATPRWLDNASKSGLIDWFHYEHSKPVVLMDTTRVRHHVNEVHAGQGGLNAAYTGKGVIMGYVDNGLDYTHPDFIDENGQTRVLYYWDHTLPFSAERTPMPYGYGQLWTAAEIQAGTCLSTEEYPSAHGTSVTGGGSGNGRANGKNKGIAPDSKIIVVETNFMLPNWTLTVADACDFLFKKADELGMPAVMNLSVGTYFGSHDGDDAAAELMEQLVDEAPGRIIVCAAGNAGNMGKTHVRNVVDSDTSFTWFRNNPSPNGPFGPNTGYFDLWSDLTDATWQYAIGANLDAGDYGMRSSTVFRNAQFSAGTFFRDTLWNGANRIATLEIYPEIVDNDFHLEVVFRNIDSTDYNLSFLTKGSGSYDLWSDASYGSNEIVSNVPSSLDYPPIVHYAYPDTLQSVVSSWNCSEKIISVGNVNNRFGHYDKDTVYHPGATPGKLSINSSKGPTRHNLLKPDVTAGGDGSLSSGPMWLVTNSAFNFAVDIQGWHVRNGGTSMASPVVAGAAALYLEKCPMGTYQTFKNDLLASATPDEFTGTVPNNAYGHGKLHALNLMLQGPVKPIITQAGNQLQTAAFPSLQWYHDGEEILGATGNSIIIPLPITGSYTVVASGSGCDLSSDPFDGTTGLDEMKAAGIVCYPNPVNDRLIVVAATPISGWAVTDNAGKTVLKGRDLSNGILVESLSPGAYFVEFSMGEGKQRMKFVKN